MMAGIIISVPEVCPRVNARGLAELDLLGSGPRGFGPVHLPFALTTNNESAVASTADGYQPVGMRPTSRSVSVSDAPLRGGGCETTRGSPDEAVPGDRSNTATALLSASATNRRSPSGESASAWGVLPSCGPAGGGSSRVEMTRAARVSTTAIRSVLPDAMNSLLPPSRDRIIADG